jgi:hypothetical protein
VRVAVVVVVVVVVIVIVACHHDSAVVVVVVVILQVKGNYARAYDLQVTTLQALTLLVFNARSLEVWRVSLVRVLHQSLFSERGPAYAIGRQCSQSDSCSNGSVVSAPLTPQQGLETQITLYSTQRRARLQRDAVPCAAAQCGRATATQTTVTVAYRWHA